MEFAFSRVLGKQENPREGERQKTELGRGNREGCEGQHRIPKSGKHQIFGIQGLT